MATHQAIDFTKGDKVNFVSKNSGEKVYGTVTKILKTENKVIVTRDDNDSEVKLNADRVHKNRGRKPGSTVEKKAEKPAVKKTAEKPAAKSSKTQTSSKKGKAEELDNEEIGEMRDAMREMMEALAEMSARLSRALGETQTSSEDEDEDEAEAKPAKKTGKKKPMATDEDEDDE